MSQEIEHIFDDIGHRPWALPDAPWIIQQSWHDLLFAHWPVPVELLASLVPEGLTIESFDGTAWVGIVPFHLAGLRPRGIPALPPVSNFPELNVRTYVAVEDKPGVYFFSLDAGNPIAVGAARTFFHLRYFDADMRIERRNGWIEYRSRRNTGDGVRAEFHARYRPTGDVFRAPPDSLDHFLTERYCLYAASRRGELYRVDIHHPPWLLQPAELEIHVNTMAAAARIELPDLDPVLHFSARQDVVNWTPEAVEPEEEGEEQ